MIESFLAVPADEERENGPKNSYVSGRDIKWVAIALAVIALAFIPVYDIFKRMRDTSVCLTQLNNISQAMTLYGTQHDDRFPPVVQEGTGSPGAPAVQSGSVYSWVSLLHAGQPKLSFACPGAQDDENASNQVNDRTHGTYVVRSSYGMYAPYGGVPIGGIERADQTILVAETSNFGAQSSFDPVKFVDAQNKAIPIDGFVIGWDNSNVEPGPATHSVTRLAFRNSSKGDFRQAHGRHGSSINSVTVGGSALKINPPQANVQIIAGQLKGMWGTPPMVP
jgi:hypothetical protein